jgi:hypothetical protein
MSIEAMVWALEQTNLDPVDKLTLLGIANHADRFGANAWPSVSTLALYVGRSEMTVRRSLRRLCDLGLISIQIQGGGSSRHGGYRPNLYTVRMRPITGDTPKLERAHTGDSAGLSPVLGQASHSPVRRTVLEPLENRPTVPVGFEDWWKAYPKRVGKRAAHTAFQKVLKGKDAPTVETLIQGAQRLASEGREYRFIPNPTTWLNQGRWEDETLAPPIPSEAPAPKPFCQECRSGWKIREEDGVERAFRCECQR